MSKYVPDITTRRWVLISPVRISRPHSQGESTKKKVCMFCSGSESTTPEEVYRVGEGKPNTPGWQIRVFPNKYPITDIHEVIVHSPHHDKSFGNLPLEHVELLFQTYKKRFFEHKKKGNVIIFCNHGKIAGASIMHPHSQIVVIPFQINLDVLTVHPIQNIVLETKYFTVYCPEFSQWPFEVWIAPKKENLLFTDTTDVELKDLSKLMKLTLRKIEHIYNYNKLFTKVDKKNSPFGFNHYIYPKENWYIRIIPRFVYRAGFELGTGLSVNIIDPVEAAQDIKNAPPHEI